jgi:hemerythrin superfamily protein
MDALNILRADHQRLRQLFVNIQGESGRQQQHLLFDSIKRQIEEHTYAEETVFYPYLARYGEFEKTVQDSFREHAHFRELLSELAAIGPQGESFSALMMNLIRTVETHVQNEEDELFPKVRAILGSSEREGLGRHIILAKNELGKAA